VLHFVYYYNIEMHHAVIKRASFFYCIIAYFSDTLNNHKVSQVFKGSQSLNSANSWPPSERCRENIYWKRFQETNPLEVYPDICHRNNPLNANVEYGMAQNPELKMEITIDVGEILEL